MMKLLKMRIGLMFIAFVSLLMMTSLMPSDEGAGIEFEKGMTVSEAMTMSKKTGKLIFIDCYTVWCGPCRRMAATSFKDPDVAKLYNDNFINLKIEMEKDPDGHELAMKYKVRAYPTLLIIDGNGVEKRKVIGMQNKDGLIMFAKAVLK